MKNINLFDLKKQYLPIKEEIDEAIREVIESSSFVLGQKVEEFENNFSNYCNAKYSVGVSSGTDALYLSLKALGIGLGDEVITTTYTFIGTVLAISKCGAKPVLIDCEKEDYNISVKQIESAITEKTKAIIPVHLYGQPVNMDYLLELAKKYNLNIIEDACQAHGAEYKGKRIGSIGKISCFSFYPTKNLGGYGDGGAITTNDFDLAEKIKLLRNCGQKIKYHSIEKGDNCRLDELQATVLNVKLKYLDRWNEQRRENAKLYNELLDDEKNIITPFEKNDVKHMYHLYVIRTQIREKLIEGLKSKGISTGVSYPIPVHLQDAYKDLGYNKESFPNAIECSENILSLPIFPELEKQEIEFIVKSIKEIIK